MTNFSTNQVMQFYVLDGSVKSAQSLTKDYTVLTFTHADGEVTTSDRIENVMYGKLTKADALSIPFTVADVTIDASVNGGVPIKGQTYTLRVSYPEIPGVGVEGWVTKSVSVYVDSTITTAALLYSKMAEALTEAFGEDALLVAEADADGISITQKDITKYYKRGVRPFMMIPFTVSCGKVMDASSEYQDAFDPESLVVKESDATPIANGYRVSDMEYFALGERGDQYRYADYLNSIETNYRVTSPKAKYDVLTVHFAYKGANQNSHKSEKDLIVVAPEAKAADLLALAQDLETYSGVKFTKVTDRGAAEVALTETV